MSRSAQTAIEYSGPVDSCRRGAVLEHLLRLSTDDRLNRFLSLASDSHVSNYVSGICFAHDIVLGAKRDSRFVGLAHGALFVERGDLATEIGISVDQDAPVAAASASVCCWPRWKSPGALEWFVPMRSFAPTT